MVKFENSPLPVSSMTIPPAFWFLITVSMILALQLRNCMAPSFTVLPILLFSKRQLVTSALFAPLPTKRPCLLVFEILHESSFTNLALSRTSTPVPSVLSMMQSFRLPVVFLSRNITAPYVRRKIEALMLNFVLWVAETLALQTDLIEH